MSPDPSSIAENLHAIREAIAHSGRDVQLIAVSKTVSTESILAALRAGQRLFGENRVQEALAKWPGLKTAYPDIRLHLIGPLQTNKIRQALGLFDVIETLDRPKLAEALAKEKEKKVPLPECYIQVNIGEEPQKAGIMPLESAGFIEYCKHALGLPVTGVMCIPPVNEAPAPYFALLASIARHHGLKHISMGMSSDYDIAIKLGATHIRIGQGVFGARKGGVL